MNAPPGRGRMSASRAFVVLAETSSWAASTPSRRRNAHDIMLERPDLVIRALYDVVDAVRHGARRPHGSSRISRQEP